MSKQRTKWITLAAAALTLIGAFGMVLFYQGAFSPAVEVLLAGRSVESLNALTIGETVTGTPIQIDLLALSKKGAVFLGFAMVWVLGAVAIRFTLGWGDIKAPNRPVKLLGVAGGFFQMLGAGIFLYTGWAIVKWFNADADVSPEYVTAIFGSVLRSSLSGLTTFALGNVMSVLFLKYTFEGKSVSGPTSRKRRISACLSFVPMLIASVAVVNALINLSSDGGNKGLMLSGSIVGLALPMVVGAIPLLVLTKSIPRG